MQLPCPECLAAGLEPCRIGNRRRTCATCNRFAQAVLRHARGALARKHAHEYARLRSVAEEAVYPDVYEAWLAAQPDDVPETTGVVR